MRLEGHQWLSSYATQSSLWWYSGVIGKSLLLMPSPEQPEWATGSQQLFFLRLKTAPEVYTGQSIAQTLNEADRAFLHRLDSGALLCNTVGSWFSKWGADVPGHSHRSCAWKTQELVVCLWACTPLCAPNIVIPSRGTQASKQPSVLPVRWAGPWSCQFLMDSQYCMITCDCLFSLQTMTLSTEAALASHSLMTQHFHYLARAYHVCPVIVSHKH